MRLVRLLLAVLVASGVAQAAIYENTITAEDEDDLFTMVQRGDISQATADTLLELLREGIDLNAANREQLYDLPGVTYQDVDNILEYRKAKGRIEDASELVAAGAITAEQFIQIAPFLRIDAARTRWPVSGKVRLLSQFTATDATPPPTLLNARVKGPLDLTAGFMLIGARRMSATPTYDPLTDSLQTEGYGYSVHLPRFFLQWKSGKAQVVAGTFTIGFGERLTLDNTRRVTPRGIYLTDDFRRPIDLSRTCRLSAVDQPLSGECEPGENNLYITPDYDWREVFRGVAASVEDLKLGGEASMSMYGFLSYQARSIYQYELYDRRFCDDPREDNNALCRAPPVYVPSRGSRLIYSTLNYLFDELSGGGHVDFKPNHRFTIGATAWASMPFFRQQPVELDFQEWSRYPNGGAFGAIGLNAHGAWRQFNFYLEAARTFDRAIGGGGGYGLVQRSTWSPKGHELELVLRYYDDKFGTPHARPPSSPDEQDGLRARNELGARLRYFGRLNRDWEFRGRADFWVNPIAIEGVAPAGVPNLFGLLRVDFTGWSFFQPAFWVDVRNRNLLTDVRGRCASGTIVFTEGDPVVCGGDLYRLAARFEFVPHKRYLRFTTQGWFTWTDDVRYRDRFRNDVMAWGELRSDPFEVLQLRLRSRFLFQDISDPAYLEQNLWTFLEVAWMPLKGSRFSLRYDVFVWLDQRRSTLSRYPNPEHRFMLDLRTSF